MLMNSRNSCTHILWDWNGTLLNDVDIVIDAMNSLLKRRNLLALDEEKYKNIFTFPVKEYYAQLGFDFSLEPFEELATEYITTFNSDKYQFSLHSGVEEVLQFISSLGINQSVLSASKEQELIEAVNKLNIADYFERIAGLNNHFAISKVERGKDLLVELNLKPHEVLLIGDTIHDYEVAKEIGCKCLLVCNGHQSYQRIKACGARIIESITDVIGLFKGLAIESSENLKLGSVL